MTATISKPTRRRAELEALRAKAERQLREAAEQMKTMQAVIEELNVALESTAPRPSPLDEVKGVLAATADLRGSNGRLSADRVAKLFGISLNQLARWLGRSRQALSKTPDAESLQPALSYFERVARLRLVTESDAEFRKWLRMPNERLQGRTPLKCLEDGQWQAMADQVDDMLTGAPI